MASDKKKRKLSKKPRKPGSPHPDGDRRRRGFSMTVEQALANKKARNEYRPDPDDPADSIEMAE